MKNFTKTLGATVAASALAVSSMIAGDALAAFSTTGLGATSTGTVNLSIVRSAEVDISAMTDISLGAWTAGSGNVTLPSTACVYSNTHLGGYTISGTGSGTAGAYTLVNGNGNTIAYTAYWDAAGADTGANAIPLTSANAPLAKTGASTVAVDCSSTNNFQLNIHISSAVLTPAPAGTYTGTLALLVSPN